ncbi:3,2-trans-enoyl-CoA isomerase [Cyphellophora attinorum]|uniref:3,2-trans-enoyl-CoA isomerase n=1 Tax=Cyphellophora attinorum TaxID=1664694 RepID=A0A0N1NYC3_9EURO|nr:3,2-trans-enoyl-CoA isomerase [Phialophora attinorum]KPI38440.1 3,2-trans-enoyl-CoA isomerase [Phialophora attinorum]
MSCALEYKAHVAIITINNPSKLGALTKDIRIQLGHHMRAAAEQQNVYITLLTGTGRFFSSGADINETRDGPSHDDSRRHHVHEMADILDLAQAFYSHSNILVTALNGPVAGLASALVSHSDFIYAAPHTYLFAAFNSIGVVVEGAATKSMVNRMGRSLANEALLMARKISIDRLVASGFVNGVFEADALGGDAEQFTQRVYDEVCVGLLGSHLSSASVLATKQIMLRSERVEYDAHSVRELLGGVEALQRGYPQEQFRKLQKGEKRHKL